MCGEEQEDGYFWSTNVLEDTEELLQWRCINQEEKYDSWKELCGQLEEKVLEKYKVEEAKTGAHIGRGDSLEWRIVKKRRHINLDSGRQAVGREFSHGSETTACSGTKVCRQEKQKRRSQAAATHENYGRYDEEDKGNVQHGCD